MVVFEPYFMLPPSSLNVGGQPAANERLFRASTFPGLDRARIADASNTDLTATTQRAFRYRLVGQALDTPFSLTGPRPSLASYMLANLWAMR